MKKRMSLVQYLLLSIAVVFLTSCASSIVGDRAPRIDISIHASEDLNPDFNGRPSPIVLRIYSLKAIDSFNNARFFELYENGEDILGTDLVAMREIEISPGNYRELQEFPMEIQSRHIGILAAYRDIDNAVWRKSLLTPLNSKTRASLTLNELSIALTTQ